MDFGRTDEQESIRSAVRALCARFPDEYWRELDRAGEYPERFVRSLTEAGWLGALIPTEYGGAGLGLADAALIIEEINASGGNAAVAHAQMYTMGTLLRHGSDEQKRRHLPRIAKGEVRLQAFGVTEPEAGSDTTRIKTMATKRGDRYVVTGKKIFISRAQHSDLLLLLARTTRGGHAHARQGLLAVRPRPQVRRGSEHGQAPRLAGGMGRRERGHRRVRGLRFRARVRCRAQVPRDAASARCSDQQQPHPRVHRSARSGDAAVVLMDPPRPMRSLMFVPAHRDRMVARALGLGEFGPSALDVAILDLEDGVPPASKEEARRTG